MNSLMSHCCNESLYVHTYCAYSMVSITVRISKEVKQKMNQLRGVNWSEVVRRAIEEEIRKTRMREASRRIDALREKSKIEWDSTEVIRQWRERRR